MEQNELSQLRMQMDAIDDNILELVTKRVALGERILATKLQLPQPIVFAPAREQEMLACLSSNNESVLSTNAIKRIFQAIINESRYYQQCSVGPEKSTIKVIVCGAQGCLSETAAKEFFMLRLPFIYTLDYVASGEAVSVGLNSGVAHYAILSFNDMIQGVDLKGPSTEQLCLGDVTEIVKHKYRVIEFFSMDNSDEMNAHKQKITTIDINTQHLGNYDSMFAFVKPANQDGKI